MIKVNPKRIKTFQSVDQLQTSQSSNHTSHKDVKTEGLPTQSVIYWMQRDQRIEDNWAILYALELAIKQESILKVVFRVKKSFRNATMPQYNFMFEGLKEVEAFCTDIKLPFTVITSQPFEQFLLDESCSDLVTDMSPLRDESTNIKMAESLNVNYHIVDAHNVVPVWEASNKQEFAARTIRPKIQNKLEEYLTPYPNFAKEYSEYLKNASRDNNRSVNYLEKRVDWNEVYNFVTVEAGILANKTVVTADDRVIEDFRNKDIQDIIKSEDMAGIYTPMFLPGIRAAHKTLDTFINDKLPKYGSERNDPNSMVLSDLSPYLHFGQISSQRVITEVVKHKEKCPESADAFIEEILIRKELSDNYCYYNKDYNNFNGFPEWAQKTLNKHRNDKREYLYTLEQLEFGRTEDQLWNAAQMEMLKSGKMYGYMRMYWCKKILEWSESPEKAQEIAIYLNDKYQLDGRDPNGYVGIAWSIGGLHDRPWFERPIFGMIRYMNRSGAEKKFDTQKYIDRWCS